VLKKFNFGKEESFEITFPLEPEFEKIDVKLIKNFKNSKSIDPEIENILIFCRGVGRKKKSSTFSYEKLDKIISKYFTLIFDYKYTLGQESTDLKTKNVITRTPLTANIFDLLKESTVEEPTYEELVVIYRLKECRNNRNIHITSLKDIPMVVDCIINFERQILKWLCLH
jgi:hypothetical protein